MVDYPRILNPMTSILIRWTHREDTAREGPVHMVQGGMEPHQSARSHCTLDGFSPELQRQWALSTHPLGHQSLKPGENKFIYFKSHSL